MRAPQTEKRCPKCGLTKPREAFHIRWPGKATLQSYCKDCSSGTVVEWARANRDHHNANVAGWRKANRARSNELSRLRRAKDVDAARAQDKINTAKYRERKALQTKVWRSRPEVREAKRAYERMHRRLNPSALLAHRLRARLRDAIKGGVKRGSSIQLLGCTIDELVAQFEQQFLPGMAWENWGNDGWHVDHIRPLKSFDLTDPAQLAQACHHTNLQPLWAAANRAKGAKYDDEEVADLC